VSIDLIVRGTCCLVPGVRGLSENIRVRSLIGRFLEHARVCYFENDGGDPVILAGSADWMPRNFFRRIEVLFPIVDPALRLWVTGELLASELRDTAKRARAPAKRRLHAARTPAERKAVLGSRALHGRRDPPDAGVSGWSPKS